MKLRIFFISFYLLILSFVGQSQSKYWVFFTDKEVGSFDPYTYFDQKAIDRRVKVQYSLFDYTDLPVNISYLNQVEGMVDSVGFSTRWFNGVSVYCNEQIIEKIKNLDFVSNVNGINAESRVCVVRNNRLSHGEILLLKAQTERFGASELKEKGITGKGVRIAILDTGFPQVDKSPVFSHIRKEKRIIATYDFITKSDYAYKGADHGTVVMSCIGGISQHGPIGLATGAEFLLARTESSTFEMKNEEDRWLAAMEWADRHGADIISSSLGYTDKRYFPEEMDGKHALISQTGNLAARKGILVVNAAGNEGLDAWRIIGAPADADSVLAVGGINPWTGYHTSFSSYGPTADKRMKPNLCGYGHVIAEGKNGLHETQGTSFACPLVAGFAACAWEINKDLTNMDLFQELEKSSDLYPYFDYAHGYGVPQASYFLEEKKEQVKTFDVKRDGNILEVVIKDEYFKSSFDSTDIELNEKEKYTRVGELLKGGGERYIANHSYDLYYAPDEYKSFVNWPGHALIHVENQEGVLERYFVVAVFEKEILKIENLNEYTGKTIRIYYLGYTHEIKI